jgi:hypothetical protein
MKVLIWKNIAKVISFVLIVTGVDGNSSGTGACTGGSAPLGSTHVRGGAEIIGPLSDYEVVLTINGVVVQPDTPTSFAPNVDLPWSVATSNPIQYKGLLVRAEAPESVAFTITVTEPLYKEDTTFCAAQPGNVLGITHNNADLKSSASGVLQFDATGAATLDVTIVYRNGFSGGAPNDQSLTGYNRFNLNIEAEQVPTDVPAPAPTDAPVPAPTEAPVPATTEAPISVPTDTPAAVPVATDAPVPATTESPVPATTDSPVPGTTDAPVTVTTDSPVPGTTDAPVPVTTVSPVPVVTEAPVISPIVESPTPIIVPVPVKPPATSPVAVPVEKPIVAPGMGMMMDAKSMGKKGMGVTDSAVVSPKGMGMKEGKKKMSARRLRLTDE